MMTPATTKLFIRCGNELREISREKASELQDYCRNVILSKGLGPRDVKPIKLHDENGRVIGEVSWNGNILLRAN